MDKREFLEIFNNQNDLLEYLKNSTNLIGAGLNLFSLGYSTETQSKVLSFLKKVNLAWFVTSLRLKSKHFFIIYLLAAKMKINF